MENNREHRFEVVTLNVWGLPFPFARARARRFERIARHFEGREYDIVGIQEAWWPFAGQLRVPGLQGPRVGNSGLALGGRLASEDRPELHRFEHATGPDRLATKGLLTARVGPLTVAVTHLQAGGRAHAVRGRQVRQILDTLEATSGPVVLMGDFNFHGEESGSEGALADAGFQDAAAGSEAPTWLPGHNPYTWPSRAQRFDRIYLRSGSGHRWIAEEVHVLPRVLSDHQPVAARLRLIPT